MFQIRITAVGLGSSAQDHAAAGEGIGQDVIDFVEGQPVFDFVLVTAYDCLSIARKSIDGVTAGKSAIGLGQMERRVKMG